jgi:hypothetical protein
MIIPPHFILSMIYSSCERSKQPLAKDEGPGQTSTNWRHALMRISYSNYHLFTKNWNFVSMATSGKRSRIPFENYAANSRRRSHSGFLERDGCCGHGLERDWDALQRPGCALLSPPHRLPDYKRGTRSLPGLPQFPSLSTLGQRQPSKPPPRGSLTLSLFLF